jgi:hypothetical protein
MLVLVVIAQDNFDSGHFESFNFPGWWQLGPAFLAGIKPCDVITPKVYCITSPCEGTNSPRLFTPGETKALAKSKVHKWSRAWLTVRGWSSSLISKIWRTVMNSEHCMWLVQFKVYLITTAWRQRNSKHFLIWWLINFLQIYFIFARIFARCCKFQERKGERIG